MPGPGFPPCSQLGPDSPWFDNPYAKSVCESRGGTWPDFTRIYLSNSPVLTAAGPSPPARLKSLNIGEGVSASSYEFDEYNISLFGSLNDSGRYERLPRQLQAAYDLWGVYPCRAATAATGRTSIPTRTGHYPGCARS